MLRVDIITPDGTVFEGETDSLSLPTPDGEITILPHHIPLISILAPGTITVRRGGREELFAVSSGVIEVDGFSIRVLADTADRAEALEEAEIERAKATAQALMTERRHDVEGFAEATAVLERELARLRTVRRHRGARGVSHPHSDAA